MSDLASRRRHPRHERSLVVEMLSSGRKIVSRGTTENVSLGGAFVTVRRVRYPVGERLMVKIFASPLDPRPIAVEAEVRWFCAGAEQQGYGISFETKAPEAGISLQGLLED